MSKPASKWSHAQEILKPSRAVPLTNNATKQVLRPYAFWRKISFARQSHQAGQYRPLILSITETYKRLGLRTYDYPHSKQGESVTIRLPNPDLVRCSANMRVNG